MLNIVLGRTDSNVKLLNLKKMYDNFKHKRFHVPTNQKLFDQLTSTKVP